MSLLTVSMSSMGSSLHASAKTACAQTYLVAVRCLVGRAHASIVQRVSMQPGTLIGTDSEYLQCTSQCAVSFSETVAPLGIKPLHKPMPPTSAAFHVLAADAQAANECPALCAGGNLGGKGVSVRGPRTKAGWTKSAAGGSGSMDGKELSTAARVSSRSFSRVCPCSAEGCKHGVRHQGQTSKAVTG